MAERKKESEYPKGAAFQNEIGTAAEENGRLKAETQKLRMEMAAKKSDDSE